MCSFSFTSSWDLLGLLFWWSRCFHAPQPLRMYGIIARPQHKPGWPLLQWCNCCYRWLATLFCVAVHAGPAVETGNNQVHIFRSLFYASIRWRLWRSTTPGFIYDLFMTSGLMSLLCITISFVINGFHALWCLIQLFETCSGKLQIETKLWIILKVKMELCSARRGSTENIWLDWSFNMLRSDSGSTHRDF